MAWEFRQLQGEPLLVEPSIRLATFQLYDDCGFMQAVDEIHGNMLTWPASSDQLATIFPGTGIMN